jgi:hypothetical protein
MVELVVATTPLQIVVINTKLKSNEMQQHWIDSRIPCTDFVKFVISNVLALGVIMRMVLKSSSGSNEFAKFCNYRLSTSD